MDNVSVEHMLRNSMQFGPLEIDALMEAILSPETGGSALQAYLGTIAMNTARRQDARMAAILIALVQECRGLHQRVRELERRAEQEDDYRREMNERS